MTENRPSPPSRGGAYSPPPPDQVLENILEHVLQFLTLRRDRNAAAQVCRSWYRAEAQTRSELFIGNCYAVAPRRVMERFRHVTAMTIKGKPRFADFNMIPPNWGANFTPWVTSMAHCYRALEKLCLKRMLVTNEDLELLARFPSFRELVLVCCDGFGTSGLAVVASKCRKLRVLDLTDDEITDDEIDWISCFPEGETCLESLIFDCVESPINFEALERLVARSPSLKKLKPNRSVSIGQLYRLMIRAPLITHLGTGSFSPSEIVAQGDEEPDYSSAFDACRSLVCLSGFREIVPDYLPAIYPVCANLTSLNFSYANISAEQLISVIRNCHKLQIFWVLDSICDAGLQAVAATCKDLRELRVFPFDAREDSEGSVSDKLEIRDSPFGDSALRSGLHHYYNMRFLWMSSCRLTRRGCKEIAQQLPNLVVEMINGEEEEVQDDFVNTLYMYRSLDGPRADAPSFVTIL
ncbi:RNI-like superfamily protein [Actinidia rufa]|uniref:RNI-like superfamily protein n=1 Tax=Actinidia rufa TaxID=165716 RepID=A0A7J0DYR3_9ERIC|nr:RNI-like superfamily protein [Actinidia rufa]